MAGNITLANHKVQLLLFADDVVLLADSNKGLQESIDRLTEFWKLNINVDKTKVVVFTLDNIIMKFEYATSYKYLGIVLSSNGSFKPAIPH